VKIKLELGAIRVQPTLGGRERERERDEVLLDSYASLMANLAGWMI